MPPSRVLLRRDPVGIERLRARVRTLEAAGLGPAGTPRGATLARFGAAIDRRLPWGGLPRGALHEVAAETPADAGAATGFAAALVGRFAATGFGGGTVLWCEGRRTLDAGRIYPPGLARFGIDPGRLIVARPKNDAEALWTVEEGLRGGVAAVVGEVEAVSLTESRRLQLAAAGSGTPALVILPRPDGASAALTRWRIAALAGEADAPRWRATLARCRGGAPFAWTLDGDLGGDLEGDFGWQECEERDEARGVRMAAPVRDRPGLPPATPGRAARCARAQARRARLAS
jgi:protein ImuA